MSTWDINNLGEVSARIEKVEEDWRAQLKRQREELARMTAAREKEYEQRRVEEAQGKPETAQVIFAIMNRSGLAHRFPELIRTAQELKFWQAGLFFINSFLVDEPNRDKYLAAAAMLVETPRIASSSLGFNFYLLGKMEQFRGNNERAVQWFAKCRDRTPLMYQHLMEQDPLYDLQSVRNHLLREEAD